MDSRRSVVGAVLVDSLRAPTRVLAARRTTPPVGLWEFPGGKVEPDEAPEAALAREIHEELGAEIRVAEELTADGGAWPISETLALRLYLAEVVAGEPRPGDSHDLLVELTRDDLDDLDWLPSDRSALPTVRALLRAPGRACGANRPQPADATEVSHAAVRFARSATPPETPEAHP